MSAWSSGTWCTKKCRREQTLSRPPAALSRRDLPYASVLASPASTSLHPHVKPCSRVRPLSSLSHPQSSHAASRSAAPCVACSCAAPATTPQHKPQKTPAQAPANPRQSPPRLNTLACPHTTPASRQHHLPSPLCCAGVEATSRHHTRPHTLSSLTGTHTPPPAAPASPARRLVLCRGLLLPHPCHGTHAALTCIHRPSS